MTDQTSPPETASVRRIYDSDPQYEWERMDRHRMEFAISLRALETWLPPPPARLLDCGGGPGRYAVELARRSYRVTLFDLSEGNLALGRQKAAEAGVELEKIEQGTALDLSRYADGEFDAVLLMGPLYHLLARPDRVRALREAARVLAPRGPLFASFITRFAPHRWFAVNDPERPLHDPNFAGIERDGHEGVREQGFVAYYAHPDEVELLLRDAGFDCEAILALEGILSQIEKLAVNDFQGAAWDYWCDYTWRIARDPSIRGAADHLLAVAYSAKPCVA